MYTYRHDQAARQIVKVILRGRKSGFVVMMDIGNQQHCEQDGLPSNVPHRIPTNVLPPRIPQHVCSLLTNHSRPDVFLFIPPKLPNRPTPEYIILELKYCRDTDPQNQYEAGPGAPGDPGPGPGPGAPGDRGRTTEQPRNIARSLMLSNKRLLTLA